MVIVLPVPSANGVQLDGGLVFLFPAPDTGRPDLIPIGFLARFCGKFAPEFLEPRLEDAALHIDVGLQLLLASLELGCDLGEPALDPLCARVADMGELLGEDGLRFAGEIADGADLLQSLQLL